MKYVKQAARFLAISILFANVLVFTQIFTGVEIPTTAALTNLECYQKFDGKKGGAGTDGSLTEALLNQYNKSNCPSSKGGNCTLSGSSSAGGINCTVGTNNQCKADFDGKTLPGTLDFDAYDKSGCSDEEGGPCKTIDRPSVSTVSCGTGAPGKDNDNGSKDSDSDEGPSSNIGKEYKEGDCNPSSAQDLSSSNCEVIKIIVLITNVISGLAATVIVAMIVLGGIQYSMAGAEAAKVQAAKQKITNALLALMLLIFGFSIIQWLVPGGLI